jgi:hypothetical protein
MPTPGRRIWSDRARLERPLAAALALALPQQSPWLVDEAAERGLVAVNHCGDPVRKRYLLEEIGCGCALFDKDGDGDLDAFLVDACRIGPPEAGDPLDSDWRPRLDGQCRLYENDGSGRFADVTEASGAGLRAFGQGVTAADYDGDGDLDLYVTCWGPNHLLENDGAGKFTDVTERAGVGDPHWSVGAAFFDGDGDGDLDLYVGNYFAMAVARDPKCWRKVDCPYLDIPAACGPKGMVPEPDTYYRNEGDGTFTDQSESSGIRRVDPRYALGVVAFDHDLDGDQDVYVGNDSRGNFLFDNDGKGSFTEMGDLFGCSVSRNGLAQASMGVAVGDFDGNGLLDVAVTNFSHDDNTVYANQGGGSFLDVTARLGMGTAAYLALGWGTEFVDLDDDGDLDFFVANGHVYPEADRRAPELTYRQQNRVHVNERGRLVDATAQSGPGLARLASFRGAAFGDVDGDGDVDALLTAQNEAPSLLVNRGREQARERAPAGPAANGSPPDSAPNGWLVLELRAGGRNPFAVGARAVARVGDRELLRVVRAGASFASSSDLRLHFGLGGNARIDRLAVTWPDGSTQSFEDVAGGRIVRLEQGGALVERKRP